MPPGDFDPLEPTDAPPGSMRKKEVMRLRATLGLPLFHHEDYTIDPTEKTLSDLFRFLDSRNKGRRSGI